MPAITKPLASASKVICCAGTKCFTLAASITALFIIWNPNIAFWVHSHFRALDILKLTAYSSRWGIGAISLPYFLICHPKKFVNALSTYISEMDTRVGQTLIIHMQSESIPIPSRQSSTLTMLTTKTQKWHICQPKHNHLVHEVALRGMEFSIMHVTLHH